MKNNVLSGNSAIVSSKQSYLKRPHIHNLLEEAIQKPVVTVIASTGYGKTQAVYAFLQEYGAITMWQQLTALDNISTRFWGNFVNVISLSYKKLASDLEMLGFPETTTKFDMFLSCVLEEVSSGVKHVVVYDDFHLLHEKKVLQFVEKFVNACIPKFSIFLISRSEPDINTVGLFAKGQHSIIYENDLRFSKSDMVRYYEIQGIQISPQTVLKLHKNTGGWIMAIRLLELYLKKGISHEEHALAAMKLDIFKLIENEIYSVISEDAQIFLVKLSLFNSLPLGLIKELFPNNEQLINELSINNSFIRHDSFSNGYHIHHLLLDYLRRRQDALSQSEKVRYYREAADWCVLNGYKIDAITYYEKTGDYGKILENALIFPHTSQEEGLLILSILDQAPKEAYKQEPFLTLLHFRALNIIGRTREASDELDMFAEKYEALPPTQENRSILCEIFFVKGLNAYYSSVNTNDFVFSDFFIKAHKYMPEGGIVLKSKYGIQEVGAYACRISSEKKKDMENYVAAVNTSVFYASKVMPGCMVGLDDLTQAELSYYKNCIKVAEKLAYQALYKARQKQQYIIEIRAFFYLLRIFVSTGNYTKIQDLLKQLDLQLTEEKFNNSQTYFDIITGWFYSAIGQGNKSASWIKNSFSQGELNIFASGAENLVKIKYFLSERKHYELLAFLESQENEYSVKSFLLGEIATQAAKAVCLYHTNEKKEALKTLQNAYYLAESNSLIMQFIELGNDMVSLVKFARKSKDHKIPDDWLSNIQMKSSTYAKRLSHITSEYSRQNNYKNGSQPKLTKKEFELLNDICQGMTRAEIALDLGLSPNYVKNRLQIIYAKLGAENPMDAIRIATLMNLLK